MSNRLTHRQTKIQEKRKMTTWRQYIKEIASRHPLTLNRRWSLLTRYPDENRVTITTIEDFEAKRDSLLQYGREYESWFSFFKQFWWLFKVVPLRPLLTRWENERSTYADQIMSSKWCYLSNTVIHDCENIIYSLNVKDACANIFNSVYIQDNSHTIYSSLSVFRSSHIFFSQNILDSSNIWGSSNLQWCQECLFCDNLTNQSYCIYNIRYSKVEYIKRKKQLLDPMKFIDFLKKWTLENLATTDCTWSGIVASDQVENWFLVYQLHRWRNVMFSSWVDGNENLIDSVFVWSPYGSDYCGVVCAGRGEHFYCSVNIIDNSNIYYSFYMEWCSFCLGCVWLKNKSFCIFNKQYTKDDWYKKVNQIFTEMDESGELGEFFPWRMNPYYFNDTVASLVTLDTEITKEECLWSWYLRRDSHISVDIPTWVDIITIDDLSCYEWWMCEWQFYSQRSVRESWKILWEWSQRTIHPDILKKVIKDEQWNHYRVIPMEVKFLKKHGLPLPRKHWLDRLKGNFRRKKDD